MEILLLLFYQEGIQNTEQNMQKETCVTLWHCLRHYEQSLSVFLNSVKKPLFYVALCPPTWV